MHSVALPTPIDGHRVVLALAPDVPGYGMSRHAEMRRQLLHRLEQEEVAGLPVEERVSVETGSHFFAGLACVRLIVYNRVRLKGSQHYI